MPYKRFYKKAGYETTVSEFMAGRKFIEGIGASNKIQMFELMSQLTICKKALGFNHKYCHANHCMGVPMCDPNYSIDSKSLRT